MAAKRGKSRFGEFLRSMREERQITLREFCKKADLDPGNYSRIERGIVPPPQDTDAIKHYTDALGVKKGSEEWQKLIDLAALDKGIIPSDIMSDGELVENLPAFFRTLRGQKPSEEEMRKLAEKIRKNKGK